MLGLEFESQAPRAPASPQRADVACFVGFVARRASPVPAVIQEALREAGLGDVQADDPLQDVPVPIEGFEAFDALFDWERRPLGPGAGPPYCETYLGAAVRAFFEQGGRQCWVVRVGDPWPYAAPRTPALRTAWIDALVPGFAGRRLVDPRVRSSWRGAAQLFGLPDVSFLALPDLADATGDLPAPPSDVVPPLAPPTGFVECSDPVADADPPVSHRNFPAPRCLDEAQWALWCDALGRVRRLLMERAGIPPELLRRDVQIVASLPLPEAASMAVRSMGDFLASGEVGERFLSNGLASAFVQLGWPWLVTARSERLPGGVAPPDGALTGVLARSVLARGAYLSAMRQPAVGVRSFEPLLGRGDRERPVSWGGPGGSSRRGLVGHVSLFGFTPRGPELLSDVTAAADESWRPGPVNRLMSVLVRLSRRLGERLVFDVSNASLWREIEDRLRAVLRALWEEGALAGASPSEAFDVRCDASTMSQADLDNGRVVCRVEFQPAVPIERIVVVLTVLGGGQVSVTRGGEA